MNGPALACSQSMHAIVCAQTATNGASKASALTVRTIQKTSASSALGHEKPDARHDEEKPAPQIQAERLYRDDTSPYDPFWDGPRLVPAFVAQLLGQVMPERRETTVVETAYGRAISPRKALLLDRKS